MGTVDPICGQAVDQDSDIESSVVGHHDAAFEFTCEECPDFCHGGSIPDILRPNAVNGDIAWREIETWWSNQPTVFTVNFRVPHRNGC